MIVTNIGALFAIICDFEKEKDNYDKYEKGEQCLKTIKEHFKELCDEFPTNATYPVWVKMDILTVHELQSINHLNGEAERTIKLLAIIVESIIKKIKGLPCKDEKAYNVFYEAIDETISPENDYKPFFQKNFQTIIDHISPNEIYPGLVDENLLTLQDAQLLNCVPNSERERAIQLVTLMMSKHSEIIGKFRGKVMMELDKHGIEYEKPDLLKENHDEKSIRKKKEDIIDKETVKQREEITKQREARTKQREEEFKQREKKIKQELKDEITAEQNVELNILEDELNVYTSELEIKENYIKDLKKKLVESEDDVRTNEDQITSLQSTLSSCEKETDDLRLLIQKQLEEINPIPDNDQIASLRSQLETKSLEIEKAKKRAEVNEGNNRNFQTIINDTETKINETLQQLLSLKSVASDEKANLEKDRDGLKKQLKVLTSSAEKEKKKFNEESDILWAKDDELTEKDNTLRHEKEKLLEEIRKYKN